MSHDNGAGKASHFLRGKGLRISKTYRLANETIEHLIELAKSNGLNVTQYLEDLILNQKIKK